ncbi:amylo-alpha-1,6-glucosidase [Nitritalea halalkaliphila]|uniref:amylo-alpha-1,6-glucosidase n=1 Tax=Nitritalea halalkaliphila TaxID=590849 RepID=UPI00058D9533|nr:amylo-alpha-1,6-glucosidase [Nitritalea halalkaliphila]
MSYIHFDKTQLINLNYSLSRETIRTNRGGCYTSTTIIGCNTRKYHGLLVAPQPQIDEQLHVLLATVHETVIQRGASFNLGIAKFPGNYSPRGHKYLEDFTTEPIPKLTYRVGGVLLQKELILDTKRDRVMIRYTLLEAHSPTKIQIKPFLAFRGYHTLVRENEQADFSFKEVKQGISMCPYPVYQPLFMQVNKDMQYVHAPNWYHNVEYIQERERGYDYQEDLIQPGYFEFEIAKGESVIFSAGLQEADPDTRQQSFEKELSRRVPRNNFENCLKNSAVQFIQRRNHKTHIIAGYPWFGWWGRDSFIAAPGLTLALDDERTFLEVVDTLVADMQGPFFPNVGSGVMRNMRSIDAPLWFFWSLQQYIRYTGDKETVRERYAEAMLTIIEGFISGTEFSIKVQVNGLLYGGEEGVALTWMDAVNSDGPVTPRIGCPVEVNALWYNALCFYDEVMGEERFKERAALTKESFLQFFWDEKRGFLADLVTESGADWVIRPNMIFAASLPHSMLTEEQMNRVVETIRSKLLTPRGLRTLSPDDPGYRGYYQGNQYTRDLAYHCGTVWPWLLGAFVDAYLRLHGKAGKHFVEKIIASFDEVMSQYGVGTVAEIYDGDPPHRPKGAISQAWSVAELLRIMREIKNL